MTGVSINGTQTWGNLHQLKPGITLEEAHKQGQKDGLDQVYFSANGKNYFIEGDGLDLSGMRKSSVGELPKIEFTLNGKDVEAEVRKEFVDDEKSRAIEFTFSNAIGISGGAVVATTVVSQIPRLINNGLNQIPFVGSGSIMRAPKTIAIAGAIGVGLMAVGAYTAFANREVESNVQALSEKQIDMAPEKSGFQKLTHFADHFSLF